MTKTETMSETKLAVKGKKSITTNFKENNEKDITFNNQLSMKSKIKMGTSEYYV